LTIPPDNISAADQNKKQPGSLVGRFRLLISGKIGFNCRKKGMKKDFSLFPDSASPETT
jgi:hypothetical protein